jgi:hypothetical protein
MREVPDEARESPLVACIASVRPIVDREGPGPIKGRRTTMQATQQPTFSQPRTALVAPILAVVFAAGTVLGMVIGVGAPGIGQQVVSVPAGDRSYDALEETRANRGLSVPAGDRSYDALEETRANRGLSVPAGDRSYDALEETRANRGLD